MSNDFFTLAKYPNLVFSKKMSISFQGNYSSGSTVSFSYKDYYGTTLLYKGVVISDVFDIFNPNTITNQNLNISIVNTAQPVLEQAMFLTVNNQLGYYAVSLTPNLAHPFQSVFSCSVCPLKSFISNVDPKAKLLSAFLSTQATWIFQFIY
jgi:hypothetical protein